MKLSTPKKIVITYVVIAWITVGWMYNHHPEWETPENRVDVPREVRAFFAGVAWPLVLGTQVSIAITKWP